MSRLRIPPVNCIRLTSFLLLSTVLYSTPKGTGEFLCESIHTMDHISVRHIEDQGIGYDQGYTTLEGFFVPLASPTLPWVPFLDIRGHIFNNGKIAANAGIGLRYTSNIVWGGNLYYDYRHTGHQHYNQIGGGLEALGTLVDYRLNAYFPFGKSKSNLYNPQFDSFKGNSLWIFRKQEFAMRGANGEVGFHLAKFKGMEFYTAAGPYYFEGNSKQTFGGSFRINIDIYNVLKLEASTSYDPIFKWIGQGQISLRYAFGSAKISHYEKSKNKKASKQQICSSPALLHERLFQPVNRQEIIILDTKKKKSPALNPLTGQPYAFWFVDNTSHSQGTYESPFNTLADAASSAHENDIIIVHPGDGTDTGMNAGIILNDGQKLFGSGIAHTLLTQQGIISIPALTSGLPLLSNEGNPDVDVITCGNSNDIEGLNISENYGNNGITINGKSGSYSVISNIISTVNGGNGIYTTGAGVGTISVIGNTFVAKDGNTFTCGIYKTNGGLSNYIIDTNLFTGINTASGLWSSINIHQDDGSISSCQCFITNNTFSSQANTYEKGNGTYIRTEANNLPFTCLIENNIVNLPVEFNAYAGIWLRSSGITPLSATLQANQSFSSSFGYVFENDTENPLLLQLNFGLSNAGTTHYINP